MKYVPLLAAAVLAVLLIGCGGGGNDFTDDGSGGGPNPPAAPRIEAVLMDPNGTITDIVQDPTNFQTNEDYTFQLVTYADGQRQVLSGVTWKTSDTTSVYGNLSANTGRFLAGASETPTPLNVIATFQDKPYSTKYVILPRQVRFNGKVAVEGNPGKGVDGVRIEFFTRAVSRPVMEVSMSGSQFSPVTAEVVAGDVVRWTNSDDVPHTVTADSIEGGLQGPNSDTLFPNGIPAGQTFEWKVPRNVRPGMTFTYRCRFHPEMVGTVKVVTDASPLVKIGSVTTAHDGTFRASIPHTATKFQIVSSTLGNGFFHTMSAPGIDGTTYVRFDTESESCRAPMPFDLPEVGMRDYMGTPILLTPITAGGTKPDPTSPCYY